MGYEPLAYDLIGENSDIAKRELYRLVESEIPVIVGLWDGQTGHAVTAVGHGSAPNDNPSLLPFSPGPGYKTVQYLDTSELATAFLVNNDAGGPFQWIQFVDTSSIDDDLLGQIGYTGVTSLSWARNRVQRLKDRDFSVTAIWADPEGQRYDFAGVDLLAAPMPPTVTLPPKDAQKKALGVFFTIAGSISEDLTIRTYLVQSNEYKRYLSVTFEPDSEFSWWMRSALLPRWVWVTEFCLREHGVKSLDRRVIAAVVVDSAAPRDTLDCLLVHIGGWVIPIPRDQRIGLDYGR